MYINHHIVIPNELVQEYKYTHESIYIFGLIQKMLNVRKYMTFNFNWIYKELGITTDNTRHKKQIRNLLLKYQEDEYLKFDCDISKINNYEIIFATIKDIKNKFVKILDYEFDTISSCNNKNIDIYKLFCIFANIKSRVNKVNIFCWPTYERISKDIGINSPNTINKYLYILKDELGLILFDNPGLGVFKDGNIKQANNIYTMNYEGHNKLLKEKIEYWKKELSDKCEIVKTEKNKNIKSNKDIVSDWEFIEKYKNMNKPLEDEFLKILYGDD
jgi:hypothetical protein